MFLDVRQQLELGPDAADVGFDGALGEEEPPGDAHVGQPYPSDPSVPHTVGVAVFDSIAHDHAHLLAIQLPGHLLSTTGIVVQAVALFQSKAVPKWVPVISLSILVTYVVPGSHAIGLVTQLPLATTCLTLAYYAQRRVAGRPGLTWRAAHGS